MAASVKRRERAPNRGDRDREQRERLFCDLWSIASRSLGGSTVGFLPRTSHLVASPGFWPIPRALAVWHARGGALEASCCRRRQDGEAIHWVQHEPEDARDD
jgi:hypothetical protein